jgi:hypothetical protein
VSRTALTSKFLKLIDHHLWGHAAGSMERGVAAKMIDDRASHQQPRRVNKRNLAKRFQKRFRDGFAIARLIA